MSWFRNVIWYTRGIKQYTKKGYEAASEHFTPSDLEVDLKGQGCLITGANSGLGKVCATELAKRGATVYLVCRNKERGENALKEIVAESKNQNVQLLELDLGKPSQVVQFAKEFISSEKALHVLINNAGCMQHDRILDEDGLESNFATNTLGTFILTEMLVPVLEKSSKSKVIVVSSGGMLLEKLDPRDISFAKRQPFDGTMAYAQNKRQQVVMTELWASRYPKIHFSVMHPGWADTPAVQNSMPDFHKKMSGKLRTPEQGADTVVWLAVSGAALSYPSGSFFQDRQIVSTHLPLAWTKSSEEDKSLFLQTLDDFLKKFNV